MQVFCAFEDFVIDLSPLGGWIEFHPFYLTATGKMNVNECEDGELAARCVHGCENLHGSYRCLEPTTTTTEKPADVPPLEQDYKENEDPLRGDHRREEDDYVEPEEEDLYREYEEETNEVEPHPDVEQDTPCPEGYFRDHDEQCKDINECDDPRLGGRCPHGCQNVDGSFFCSEPTTTTTTTTTTVQPPVECPEGFQRTSEGNCEDINECDDPNLGGRCPYGCQNVEGSFFCSEPPPVATRAPQQPEIQEVSPTESSSTESPCGDGFRRNQGGYCEDIDECREQNTGCEHCKNVHGGFECFCPQGYELREDQKTCEDINECEIYSQEDSNAIPGSSSLCTHDCENLPGSFACHCPENFHLDYDQRTCVRDSCADLTTFRKTLCSHNCLDTGDGFFSCQCPTGYVLATDFKTCQQVADPCSGHTTCHPGRCFPVEDHHSGQHTFRCDCPEGFTEKHQQCLDVDECSRGLHRCTHECRNKEGGYDCICPAGFELAEDGATCLDQDECLTLEKPCGGQQCVNTHGSYKCVCPEGHELHEDGVTCTLVDPCQRNNGGCSHQCRMYDQNRVTCSCPEGYELSYDGRTCQDVDECSQPARGECDPINGACVNSEGSYSCLCKPGYLLGTDNRTCLSQHPCESAGCQHFCEMNSQSEPICSCRMGFKLDKDRRSCLEIRNLCPPIRAPEHGEMRCTRSRHPTQLFYKTRCSIWCHKGYKLDGSAERTCNGSGTWNGDEPVCVPKACPRLPRPHYGTIFPTSCMLNGSAAGARCMLHCFPKYKPVGKQSAICDANNNWFPSGELTCVSVQETENRVEIIKPFIRCPEDVTIVAPRGQSAFRIRLQRPQTNVDWWKYVDTHPEWAKHLEGTVPLGTTDITFRARSPNANLNEICRMKVTVKEPEPPEVTFCPESFNVQLEDGEAHKPVYWKEPVFTTRSSLKNIYKSRQPGERFAPGTHFITYVATDIDGHNSKCTFRIVVKEPPSAPPKPVQFIPVQKPSKLLDNHESFLVCPGKAAVRIDTNYPLHLPAGCYVKNILIRYDVIRKPKQQEEQQQNSQQIQRIPPHQRFLLHQPQRPQFFWPHHNALPLRHHHQQQQHRWAFPHLLERGRWQ
ncbi:latent-transforming growth factor beta-binding protein 4 [Sergentomyia squamirostris]